MRISQRSTVPLYLFALALLGLPLGAQSGTAPKDTVRHPVDATAIDAYLRPYVASNNFAGSVLVMRGSKVVFERSYGEANRATHSRNTAATRFHVASVSMQFTAAAVLRLIDRGALRLDTRVSAIVPGVVGGDSITVRQLLEQRSGLPDINARPDYASILVRHQTPASLVAAIEGDSLLFSPGSQYLHEEHSAYNLLALIIEKRTGRPFAEAMQTLVFRPAGLSSARADDDSPWPTNVARGYQPRGVSELEPATEIHWSAKAGNASVYLTARDYARFSHSLLRGRLLSDSLRAVVLDTAGPRVGYGWFRGARPRFGEAAYYMNGRAPGFASFVLYLPREDMMIVAFSNVYASVTTDIGYDVAAIATGKPYAPFALPAHALPPDSLGLAGARFTFGADFYQPNATLAFEAIDGELFLRWPTGDLSPLIPLDRDHLIDRAYWQQVSIERDGRGRAVGVAYDRFHGTPAESQPTR